MDHDRRVRKSLANAIAKDDKDEVERLLQFGGRLNMYIQTGDRVFTTRYTLLGAAISYGANAVFEYLVEQGADVNKVQYRSSDVEQEKVFPLHLACLERRLEMISKLITSGAKVDAQIEGPRSVEEEAGSLHYTGDGNTGLHWAVLNSRRPELLALLAGGADPRLTNHRGETPFALACDRYKPDLIRALCRAGGAVETQDIFGDNPLDSLLGHNGDVDENCQLLKLVLHAGYKPSIQLAMVLHRSSQSSLAIGHTRGSFLREILRKYDQHFVNWLKDWFFNARSLKCACRDVIRETIFKVSVSNRQGIERTIQTLDIPVYFKDYLLLNTCTGH